MGAVSDERPIKVGVIDVERCPDAISAAPNYSALWALIREHGRPLGMIKIPFDGAELTRAQLTEAIAAMPPQAARPSASRSQPGRLPSISVVIPTMFERLEGLRACLSSLSELDYPEYEVIVVDNRPQGSPPISVTEARMVCEPLPGISAARNRGLAAATGEVIAFTDDDVEVDPGWLLAIGERLRAHPEEACVTGITLPRELETPAQIAVEEYYGGFGLRTFEPASHHLRVTSGPKALLSPATVDAIGEDGGLLRSFSLYATGSFGHGANMAVRSDVLRDLGGFDVALGTGTPACGGEDLAMFARLIWQGYSIGFDPAAIVHHIHRREDDGLRRQIEGYGIGWGALLLALVLEDPRHLARMLATAPRGLRAMGTSYRHKLRSGSCAQSEQGSRSRTPELARLELHGIAAGPARYLRSRHRRAT